MSRFAIDDKEALDALAQQCADILDRTLDESFRKVGAFSQAFAAEFSDDEICIKNLSHEDIYQTEDQPMPETTIDDKGFTGVRIKEDPDAKPMSARFQDGKLLVSSDIARDLEAFHEQEPK